MPDKKTGFLFSEEEGSPKKGSPKKNQKKNALEDALNSLRGVKDKQVRKTIIQEIASSKESWVCEALIQALDDPSEDIRNFIIEELSSRENLDPNLLYRRLNKPPWYVKTGCLRILGTKKNSSSIKYIETLVDDPNIEVRRTLALALGEIGGKRALSLLAKLTTDNSPFVRAPARQALQEASQIKFT